MLASIVATLALPAWLRARRNDRIRACASHLRDLDRLRRELESSRDPNSKPPGTGGDLWKALAVGNASLLACPVKRGAPVDGVDYRGPAGDIAPLADGDPIGADRPLNHSGSEPSEGGNVLLKSGEVQTVFPFDPLWEQAGKQTK
jgi:hypothetical protein